VKQARDGLATTYPSTDACGGAHTPSADTLTRAIHRQEVRADVPFEVARELGQAMLWHRFLVTGDPITDELIEHIVDDILIPYTRAHVGTSTDSGSGQ